MPGLIFPRPWPKPRPPGPIVRRPYQLYGCEVLQYEWFYKVYTLPPPPVFRCRSLVEIEFSGPTLVDAAMDVFGGMAYDKVDSDVYSKGYNIIGLKGRFEYTMRKKIDGTFHRLIYQMGYYYGATEDGYWRIGWGQMEAYVKQFCEFRSPF